MLSATTTQWLVMVSLLISDIFDHCEQSIALYFGVSALNEDKMLLLGYGLAI
jgi:hypothetical protein